MTVWQKENLSSCFELKWNAHQFWISPTVHSKNLWQTGVQYWRSNNSSPNSAAYMRRFVCRDFGVPESLTDDHSDGLWQAWLKWCNWTMYTGMLCNWCWAATLDGYVGQPTQTDCPMAYIRPGGGTRETLDIWYSIAGLWTHFIQPGWQPSEQRTNEASLSPPISYTLYITITTDLFNQ